MIDAIIGEYKNAAIKYGEFTGVNARKANKQHDIIVNCYLQLKELESIGSLKELLGDEDDNVRLWAGSHLLLIMPELAEKTLEALHLNGSFVGFSAKMTLQEWKKGRLSFVYDNYKVSW